MASPIAVQLVQYDDDSVEVSFSDGAKLQLSPCGATFSYHMPAGKEEHSLLGATTIQQRTQYTISRYWEQVQLALDFRNRFAVRPYVCKEVLQPEAVDRLHIDLLELKWPLTLDPGVVETLADGSLQLIAVDHYGAVTLAPSQQLLTVRYLCKVGQVKQRNKFDKIRKSPQNSMQEISTISHVETTIDHSTASQDDMHKSEAAILDEGHWSYSWVTQHFSVHLIPDCWKHPCEVLLQFAKKNSNSVHFEDEEHDQACEKPIGDTNQSYVHTVIPRALPLNCLASHLHKSMQASQNTSKKDITGQEVVHHTGQGRLKVICCQGIIYRFLNTCGPCIEVYPGDGSVLRSSGLAGHYFTHHIYRIGKVDERIHSVIHPPPNIPGEVYSISTLVGRGARFLQYLCEQNLNLLDSNSEVCWESQSMPFKEPLASVVLEECVVEGVGRFTAHSSGRVRVLFTDRTALDTITDWSARFNHCREHSDGIDECVDIQTYRNQVVTPSHLSDLPEGMCRLLLPNGQYQFVHLNTSGQYHRYTQAALEWIQWVNTGPAGRSSFYKDTVHDPEKLCAIEQEIKKIKCFNYLLENNSGSKVPSSLQGIPGTTDHTPYSLLQELADENTKRHGHKDTDSVPLATVVMATDMAARYSSLAMDSANHLAGTDGLASPSKNPTRMAQSKQSSLLLDRSEVSFHSVQEALRRTSLAIKDLDKFLGQNGETRPVRDVA